MSPFLARSLHLTFHNIWINIKSLKVKSSLTIIRVQDLHSSELWEFKGRHHRLRQNDLEGLWHFIFAIWQDPDLPDGCGLARVELHLFLRFPPEIFVLFCGAILCANTLGRTWREKKDYYHNQVTSATPGKCHTSGISNNVSPWSAFGTGNKFHIYLLRNIHFFVNTVKPDICEIVNGHSYTDIVSEKDTIKLLFFISCKTRKMSRPSWSNLIISVHLLGAVSHTQCLKWPWWERSQLPLMSAWSQQQWLEANLRCLTFSMWAAWWGLQSL